MTDRIDELENTGINCAVLLLISPSFSWNPALFIASKLRQLCGLQQQNHHQFIIIIIINSSSNCIR